MYASTGNTTWDWYNNLESSCTDTNGAGCDLDVTNHSYHSCSSQTGCKLKENTLEGANPVYGYGSEASWITSPFTRVIKLEPAAGGLNATKVTVMVTWPAHLFNDDDRTVTLQTWLYDHYAHYQ